MERYQIIDCFTWEDEDGFGHFVLMDENRTDAEREMFKRILELEKRLFSHTISHGSCGTNHD